MGVHRVEIEVVSRRIVDFIYQHGSPQQFPRALHFLSKDHGPDWHDTYQNILIETLCASQYLVVLGESFSRNGMQMQHYQCLKTLQMWEREEEEWRMSMVRSTLRPLHYPPKKPFPVIGAALPENADKLTGERVATAGHDPNVQTLSLAEFEEFLTELA